ncbi:hypothetical protein N9301_03205 [Paracoccaceae bacterium]|nr:hypothetical protein [Paracoccaceae bacterium]
MSKFVFPPSILSRPTYGVLERRDGMFHIIIAEDEGAEAVIHFTGSDRDFLDKSHIIFIAKTSGDKYLKGLKSLDPAQLYIGPSYPAAVSRLVKVLEDTKMGAQFYLTGTEGVMGQAQNEIMKAGFPHSAIQTEHMGSVARRIQCVHCKGITEDVITDPFACGHCGLNLFVRDHYSRRLAAYQGVRVDAEDHGNVPKSLELYK